MNRFTPHDAVVRTVLPQISDDEGEPGYYPDGFDPEIETYAGEHWVSRLNRDWAGRAGEAEFIAPLSVIAGRIAAIRGVAMPEIAPATDEGTVLYQPEPFVDDLVSSESE